MTSEVDDEQVITRLRQQLRQVVAESAGPLRRVSIRSGDTELEVEWPGASADFGPVIDYGPSTARHHAVPESAPLPAAPDDTERRIVVSPIVGTFYRAAEPGAAPFVEIGDVIEVGQVIGIVEAMKLMNHITAEQAGKVSEVLVGDGEPVEFQQPLIALVSG